MATVTDRLRRVLLAMGIAIIVGVGSAVSAIAAPSAVPDDSPSNEVGSFALGPIDLGEYPVIAISGTVSGAASRTPLDTDSFVVIENGEPQTIDSVTSAEPTPLEVMIAFDRSGSMRPYLEPAVEAMVGLVERLPPGTRVGVVSFSGRVTLDQALSDDRSLAVAALEAIVATGNTAMYDALALAAEQFDPLAERRIVLLSDGGDNASDTTLDEAIEARTGIGVEIIELVTPESRRSILQEIADDGIVRSYLEPTELEAGSFAIVSDDIVARLSTPVRLSYTSATSSEVISLRVGLAGEPLGALATVDILTPVPSTTVAPTTTTLVPSTTVAEEVDNPPATTPAVVVGDRSSSGWPTATPLVAAFGVMVGIIILLAGLTGGRRRTRRRLTPRLDAAGEQVLRTGQASGARGLLSPERTEAIDEELGAAGIATSPAKFAVGVGIVTLLVSLLLGTLFGPVGFIGILTPWIAMRRVRSRTKKRRLEFIAQLPDSLQIMSAMLRSGYGIPQALDSLAKESADPTGEWLERVLMEVRTGRELSDALRNLGKQVDSLDFDWVVVAIELNQEIGGDLSDTFDTIAVTIRDREKLRGQVQALTAEGRVSAYVMLVLPPGVTAFMYVSNPEFAKLITEPVGLVLMGIAGALMLAGFAWITHMVNKVAG